MKTQLVLLLTIFVHTATAKDYYVSNSGNDANNGTSSSTPWKTIDKVNSSSFSAGDNIFFKRGDTFYGGIIASNAGRSGSPITYCAYGSGAKPVITGFTSVSSWTNTGGNIWESTSAVSSLSTLNTVLINGVSTPMGRFPNGDATYPFLPNFDIFQSSTGTGSGASSITSSSLSGTPDWTGADVVVRINQWTFGRSVITGQSGGTLNFTGAVGGGLSPNWGFFIQNDIRTLDQQGEWYYNPSTKKISIYSTSSPTNVTVSTVDTLFYLISNIPSTDFTDVDNITFNGANTNAIFINGNLTFSLTNCDVSYSGFEGLELYGGGIKSGTISNNTFYGNGSSGIFTTGEIQDLTITNNNVNVSGVISAYKQNDYTNSGIGCTAPGSLIQYNTVDSSAYCGITFRGSNIQTRNNVVNHSAMVRGDAAGIYTGFANETGKVIDGNIVLNSMGNPRGTSDNSFFCFGIYIDDYGTGVQITNNTLQNCRTGGIYMHNSNNLTARNNTIYNCGAIKVETMWANGGVSMDANKSFAGGIHDNIFTKNIIFAITPYQYALNYYAEPGSSGEVGNFGTIDSNYYVKISSPSNAIYSYQTGISVGAFSLATWQSQSSKDAHSQGAPKSITSVDSLMMVYNPNNYDSTISLSNNYIDVKGSSYNGSITLAPYTSAVLIKEGPVTTNQPPVANAGTDQTISLPIDSIRLSGSGNDTDGKIVSFLWTKISGPSSYNITNPNSQTTNVSGLVQGVYMFQVKVTDNNSATGTDTVNVTVNAAANIPPTANAGSNQTIALPTNTANLSGSGSDSDGTIASYLWTKISGPSTYSIPSPNSATTNISSLVQGVYYFQLTVTDNSGTIGTASVRVAVNAAANQPPTADAGLDQTITLPITSVTLSGSGSDADGTITSYQWTKISGPSTYTIAVPNSAATSIVGLTQGVYQFQLTITDNSGDIGTSNVQVTVNAAINMLPSADAGSNQTMTLPTNSVNLSGSGSDADGTITSYQWAKISGPSTYNIASPNSATTNISGLVQGVYQFQLTVTDNNGGIGTNNVQLTVNGAANIPPTAVGGSNKSITLPTNSVTLSGSGSDADGTIASYQWTKIAGPTTYSIASPASPVTDISGLVQGVYQFQLTVTDNNGAKGTANVQIAVNATPSIPPVADAGANKSIVLPSNTITLSGSGSDADGTIVSYNWTKISGPSSFNIMNPASPATDLSDLVQGVYQFKLAVTDNDGNIGTDIVSITVNAAPNIPPTADAGSNKSITLPSNNLSLSGSGSDADGTIASYNWTKISGPSTFSIISPGSATTNVSGLVQGVYQFQLAVTDNNGAIGIASMRVTVNPAPNILPTANAGSNKNIILPTNSVNLSGSGSDPDGTISSYLWTKISGPSAYNIVNPLSPGTDVSGLTQGVYNFQLTVTDNDGGKGTSTVQVTVNAAANLPPTANAGSNKSTTLPTNSTSLTGSGNDADGTISNYKWTKISGPSAYNIVNLSSPVTDVSGLVQGLYKFQLTVTDNNGDIGTATVQITVNAAANIPPTVDAGSNKNITLPASSVSLSGSGSDADGTIASYQWTKISGPSSFNITSPNSPSTNVLGLVQGVYQFQLNVVDNSGATGKASVQVTVNAAANIPPTATAGSNHSITLPTNSVSLAGNGRDADGTIESYKWIKTSGPSSFNIASPGSASTNVSGLVEGIYQFQLTVTDNNGDVGTATTQVTVNKAATTDLVAPNKAPVAKAGNDTTIVYPDDSVTLNGTGNDADGNVVGYFWNQLSGPSVSTILSNNTAVTNITNLVEGTYEFELTVTDTKGLTGKDTVSVTVASGRFAREDNSLKVYPNPVHDIATIEINSGKSNTKLTIVITDMRGETVYKQELVSSLSDTKLQIDMSNLKKGVYVITVFFDDINKKSVKVLRM
ncbi:MAG TPA: T9SS type A sorting domain-containing protein [Hanamia sp.]